MLNCIKVFGILCLVVLFSACEKDKKTSDPAPVANAKPTARLSASNFEPREYSTFILDVSQTFDLDGDALTFTIEQRSGTTAQRSAFNGSEMTVTVPQISGDESAVFRLTVNDGTIDDTAQITVTFINNDPPVARLSASTHEPREKSEFTLDASASFDDETVNLTYTFEQVSGPAADAIDVNGAVATITAPEVSEDSAAVFRVTVGDGDDTDDATVDMTFTNIFRTPRYERTVTKTDTLMLGKGVRPIVKLPFNHRWPENRYVLASDDPNTAELDQKVVHFMYSFSSRSYEVEDNIVLEADISPDTQLRHFSFPEMFGDAITYIGFVPGTDEGFLLVITYDAASDTYTYSERGRFALEVTDIAQTFIDHRDVETPSHPRSAASTPDFPKVPLFVLGQPTGGLFQGAPVFQAMGTDANGNTLYHMTAMDVLSLVKPGGPYYDVGHTIESREDVFQSYFAEFEYYDHMDFGSFTWTNSSVTCDFLDFCLSERSETFRRDEATYSPAIPHRMRLEMKNRLSDFAEGYFYTDGEQKGPHAFLDPYLLFSGVPGSGPEFGGILSAEWDEGAPVDVAFAGFSHYAVSTPEMPELVMLVRREASNFRSATLETQFLEVGFGAQALASFDFGLMVAFPEKGQIHLYEID